MNFEDLLNQVTAQDDAKNNEYPVRLQEGITAFCVLRSDADAGFAIEVVSPFIKDDGTVNMDHKHAVQAVVVKADKLKPKQTYVDKGQVIPLLLATSIHRPMLKHLLAGHYTQQGSVPDEYALTDPAYLAELDEEGHIIGGSIFIVERTGSGFETKYTVSVANEKKETLLSKNANFETVEPMSKSLMEWAKIYQAEQDARLAKHNNTDTDTDNADDTPSIQF